MKALRQTLLFVIILTNAVSAQCQQTRKISYDFFYTVPQNMSIERARIVAAEEARAEALVKEFGRNVSRSSVSVSKKEGDEEIETFMSIAGNDVKGEWIADLKEPLYSYSTNSKTGETSMTVKVFGLVSEISGQRIPLDVKVLCNGTEDRYESLEFKSQDWFFVSMISPVSGYVSIFLEDNQRNIVCMLPYVRQSVGAMPVTADEKQIFFSYDDAPMKLKNYVVQYSMTCDGIEETDILYVVFSTDPYSKPAMEEGMVSYMDFNNWLADLHRNNKSVYVLRKPILIKSAN